MVRLSYENMASIRKSFAGSLLLFILPMVLSINYATVPTALPHAAAEAVATSGSAASADQSAAPNTWKASFTVANLNDGSTGKVVIQVHPDWAPLGAQRFKQLLDAKFFDNSRFFRVISGFMAQFGIAGDSSVSSQWSSNNLKDDPFVKISNTRGRLSFASAGKDTRSTQIFINFADNLYLDDQGFTPFGEVVQGMNLVDKLYSGYGEAAPLGKGPDQVTIEAEGNSYLDRTFPKLSTIQVARVLGVASSWGRFRRVSFALLGTVLLLSIGTATLYRTGSLEKLHAKLKARLSSAAAVHEP